MLFNFFFLKKRLNSGVCTWGKEGGEKAINLLTNVNPHYNKWSKGCLLPLSQPTINSSLPSPPEGRTLFFSADLFAS